MTFARSVFCVSSTTYNGAAQLAAQAGTLLFPWKMAGMGFLAAWAALTSDHLLQPVLFTSPKPKQLLHAPERSCEAGITPLLAHARSPELCAAATTASAGPQSQAAAPRSHRSWALLIHGFCCHSKGRVLVYLMSHSGWLSQKHCSWKKAVSLSIRLLQLLKSGGWVRVYTSLQREDSSLLQKEETECYLSKLSMLYANNYMLQGTFFYIYKLSSLDAMEGRQFQVLTRVSLT